MLDAVVVGAGQAGLGISYCLARDGREHVVLERGRIGETWRSQRWDSFAVNTPNAMNALPGTTYEGDQPDGFFLRDELVESFEQYARRFDLPIRTGVTVTSIDPSDDGTFVVTTDDEDQRTVETKNVVIASGIMCAPKVPAVSAKIDEEVLQLHAADYRNPAALPPGAVVIIGSGQSGCQIAEDLVGSGRHVYLCTSRVGRIPRRYRGRDILEWWDEMGFLDAQVADLDDPSLRFAAQPQVSGVGRYGHTVSLQQMAAAGVILFGRLADADGHRLELADDLAANVRFADEAAARFEQAIDAHLEQAGRDLPPRDDDPADDPHPDPDALDAPRSLDLAEAGVGAIIWCTGFTADFGWINCPVLDERGAPQIERGVSSTPGLYFLGFPWLHTRKSGIIYGIDEDARHIAEHLGRRRSTQ